MNRAPDPESPAASQAVNWLDEIQRLAGDISPAAAAEVERAAWHGYRQYDAHWGPSWGQLAARSHARGMLARLAAEADPAVEAARHAWREAQARADGLFTAAAGPDGRADLGTPEGEAAHAADHEAEHLHGGYTRAWAWAFGRHSAEIQQAWAEADADFMSAHAAELEAAWPAGFTQLRAPHSGPRSKASAAAGPGVPASPRGPGHLGRTALPTLDFPGAPAARPAGGPSTRAGHPGVIRRAWQARPRRLR